MGRVTIFNCKKFPRKSRLLTRQDFQQVFDNASKFAQGPFVVLIKANQLEYPRLGVVLSKKKIALSVQRNRIRRLIREAFRVQSNLGGLDVVVLPKKGADSLSNSDLKRGLIKQWQKCVNYVNR